MKSRVLLFLGVCAAIVVGCSSAPTRKDTGPIHASTFSFVQGANAGRPGYVDRRAQVHAAIQESLVENLAGRGLTKVAEGGDLTVAYLVIVGNNVSTAMINDYFGYGRDSDKLQEKATKAYSGSKNPNYFEAGTLLVDLIDSKSGKLLFRNFVVRPTLRDPSPELRAQHIHEAVNELLKDAKLAK